MASAATTKKKAKAMAPAATTRKKTKAMAPAAQEDWFIMYGIPKVSDEMSKELPNASFTFNEVPLLSHLTVPSNVATPAGSVDYPYIAATDDCGLLLLCGYTAVGLTYYVCDPYFRRTLGVLPPDGGFSSRHSVGLIRNRLGSGIMVAKLNTGLFNTQARRITLSCTRDLCEWDNKEADCGHICKETKPWCCDGVLSHKGFLWWSDLSSCILACDPFLDTPPFYQIMFPHVPDPLRAAWFPVQGDKYRCLKVSKGRLRYVQIHGEPPLVSMWTLSSNNPSDAAWELKLKVHLPDIWSHRTYKSSMLPEVVPTVALVHPMNANRVYFFLGHHILCVNLKKKKLRQCLELNNQELPALSSLVVHSWNLPAGTTKIHLSGSDKSHVPGVHFLGHYDSVDGFLEKALAVMSRSCPELFGMGLDELEEDEDQSVTMDESDEGDDSEME
ncbi:uncharacterized protein LOC119307008 [Triticum dicoccoides]|uniref:uncharacterized protein LOC119307008 n=1 Tax=Triticum dicoccoides TaxID=85692 RepID=UPI000E7AE2B3|nr:uncharacterized protein LOC119307008 [Triticum dicoccoides]